jgi:hypothetical protein
VTIPLGPRLDDPTGIGTDGRTRTGSLLVATLAALAVALGLATALGVRGPLFVAGGGATFTAAAVALIDAADGRAVVAGHVLLVFAAPITAYGLVAGLFLGGALPGLVVVALAVAAFGAAAAWADTGGDGTVTSALGGGLLSVAVLLAILVVTVLVTVVVGLSGSLLGGVVVPTGGGHHLTWFLGVLALALLPTAVACDRLPVAQLAPRDRRATIRSVQRRGALIAAVVGCAALIGAWVLTLLDLVGVVDAVLGALPPVIVAIVGAVAGTPLVRIPLLLWGTSAVVLLLLAGIASRLGRGTLRRLGARYASVVAGGVLALVAASYVAPLFARVTGIDRITAVLGLLLFAASLLMLLIVVALSLSGLAIPPVLAGIGVLPSRTSGAALMAGGTFVAAAIAAGSGVSLPVAVGGVAGALVAWDCATFGRGLTDELGLRPDVRRTEATHALVVLLIAGGGVLAALGVGSLAALVPGASGLALALASIGVVLLLVRLS